MSSYLTILAQRALDQPQPIRPRLPSLFEPGAVPRVNFREAIVDEPSRQQSRTSPRFEDSDSAAQKPPAIISRRSLPRADTIDAGIDDRPHEMKSFSQSIRPMTPQPERHDERVTLATKPATVAVLNESANDRERTDTKLSLAPESIKPTVQVAQSITIEQMNVVERTTDAPAQGPTKETSSEEPQPVSPHSIVVKPEVTRNVAEPVFGEPQLLAPEPETSIKITIGRVDVRAIMPPVQSTATVVQSPAMKALSLDEYLKQRNGEHG